MLRRMLFGLGVALLVAAAVLRACASPVATPVAIWGAILVASLLLERWRYRGEGSRGGPGWERTGERFVDPESGRTLEVFFNARTGGRRYEPVDPSGPGGIPPT